jgi:hypothetical protein
MYKIGSVGVSSDEAEFVHNVVRLVDLVAGYFPPLAPICSVKEGMAPPKSEEKQQNHIRKKIVHTTHAYTG